MAVFVYLVAELPDVWLVEAVGPLGVEPCLGGGLFCGVFIGSAIVKRDRYQWFESSRVVAARKN